MMRKVEELTGDLLDAAVAKAEGLHFSLTEFRGCLVTLEAGGLLPRSYGPSWDWEHGGPIIERERISLDAEYTSGGPWTATASSSESGWVVGDTPLVAAMRAFVTSKLGPEIEL